MAQRFIEVKISRHVFTTVNILIDDEDKKYEGLFDGNGKLSARSFSLLQEEAHAAADKVAEEYDWETDTSETDIDSAKEVTKEEATLFGVWDAKNKRKFES